MGLKGIRGILFNGAVVLSCLLMAASVALWLRARGHSDHVFFRSDDVGYLILSGESGIQLCRASMSFYGNLSGPGYEWDHYGLGVYRFFRKDQVYLFWLRLPHWSLVLATSILPAIAGAAALQSRRPERKIMSPLCRRCSYNLTGNISGVCPECGTRIPGRRVISKSRF
jgi:hypothetical protein